MLHKNSDYVIVFMEMLCILMVKEWGFLTLYYLAEAKHGISLDLDGTFSIFSNCLPANIAGCFYTT